MTESVPLVSRYDNDLRVDGLDIDTDSFFRQGVIAIRIPASRSNDTSLDRSEAALLTDRLNQSEVLRKNFFDDISPLFRRTIPDGGIVETIVPSSPYAYGGIMVVAAAATLFADYPNGEVVPAVTAFDLTSGTRIEYFRQVLAGIQAQTATALSHCDGGRVMAYENTVPSVSSVAHRLPRTIALPHMHVIRDGDWINQAIAPPHSDSLTLEQCVMQDKNFFAEFRDRWFYPRVRGIADNFNNLPALIQRMDAPFGYTILSGIGQDVPLAMQAEYTASLLMAHHRAYADFMADHLTNEPDPWLCDIISRASAHLGVKLPDNYPLQPSYRTYIYYKNSHLAVTISPIVLSVLGAMEGMETAVDRGLHHESLFTDEEVTRYIGEVALRLHSLA